MTEPEPRKPIPMGVRLQAALLMLGFPAEAVARKGAIEWDHQPALWMRERDPETGAFVPDQHDPRFITPRLAADHAVKTRGTPATTAGSDVHGFAKAARIGRETAAHQARLLAKASGEETERPKRSRFPSRPFPKRKDPKR